MSKQRFWQVDANMTKRLTLDVVDCHSISRAQRDLSSAKLDWRVVVFASDKRDLWEPGELALAITMHDLSLDREKPKQHGSPTSCHQQRHYWPLLLNGGFDG